MVGVKPERATDKEEALTMRRVFIFLLSVALFGAIAALAWAGPHGFFEGQAARQRRIDISSPHGRFTDMEQLALQMQAVINAKDNCEAARFKDCVITQWKLVSCNNAVSIPGQEALLVTCEATALARGVR